MPHYNTIAVYYKYRYIHLSLLPAKITSVQLCRKIFSDTQRKSMHTNGKSSRQAGDGGIKKLPRLNLDSLFCISGSLLQHYVAEKIPTDVSSTSHLNVKIIQAKRRPKPPTQGYRPASYASGWLPRAQQSPHPSLSPT